MISNYLKRNRIMSLRSNLITLIWQRGYLSLDDIEAYCKVHRFKLSNAERRLRPSESPTIVSVERNGAIIGYKPKPTDIVKRFESIPTFKPKVEKQEAGSLFS